MSALKPSVTTTLSTKGQLILPKAVRENRGWKAGDRISVEETADGVLLRREQEPLFPPTRLEDVVGMIKYAGPPVSIDDMKAAPHREAARRWALFESTGTDYDADDLG